MLLVDLNFKTKILLVISNESSFLRRLLSAKVVTSFCGGIVFAWNQPCHYFYFLTKKITFHSFSPIALFPCFTATHKNHPTMALTTEQLALVQTSWAKVVPIADIAADLFYGKLFELDPELRPLFPDEMADQKKKLMMMISLAVDGLTNLEDLVPKVEDLGRRHSKYFKVTPPMYATVGAALLDTLAKGLGDGWDEAHKEAWTLVYSVLSNTMIGAGEEKKSSE